MDKFFGPFSWIADSNKNLQHEGHYGPTMSHFMKDTSWNQEWDIKALSESITTIPESKILDIGCGDGRIAYRLQQNGAQGIFYGIDLSEAAYKSYQSRASEFKIFEEYIQGDIFSHPFSTDFDVAYIGSVSINCFTDINSVFELIRKAKEITCPTGVLVVSAFTSESEKKIRNISGTISAENYIGETGKEQLMWRGFHYDPPFIRHNSYVDDHRADGVVATLMSSVERLWIDKDIVDIAKIAGWNLRSTIPCYVGDGGAEGLEVSTLTFHK